MPTFEFAANSSNEEDRVDVTDDWLREKARARLAVRNFVTAAQTGALADFERVELDDLQHYGFCPGGGWRNAMRQIARISAVHENMTTWFTSLWHQWGATIRSSCNDDLVLADGLRRLLPTFQGPESVQLYRGEVAANRRRRLYGLSWTPELGVARHHAKKHRLVGGGVVVSATVPNAAIICGPLFSHSSELEYLIDRRRLKGIEVQALERFR